MTKTTKLALNMATPTTKTPTPTTQTTITTSTTAPVLQDYFVHDNTDKNGNASSSTSHIKGSNISAPTTTTKMRTTMPTKITIIAMKPEVQAAMPTTVTTMTIYIVANPAIPTTVAMKTLRRQLRLKRRHVRRRKKRKRKE